MTSHISSHAGKAAQDAPSPVNRITFGGREWLLKRDDLIPSAINGNKARKLAYFIKHSPPGINTLISYGGVQSNTLVPLATLAKLKNWCFHYYSAPFPGYLKRQTAGNLQQALQLGTIWHESRQKEKDARTAARRRNVLFLRQGIAEPEAEYGLRILAAEIHDYASREGLHQLSVFLPSGTGSSALFLQKNLPFPVYTVPCLGDTAYLQRQMALLSSNPAEYPQILEPPRRYRFAQPYAEFLQIQRELLAQTGVEFDLLYDPPGWLTLLAYQERLPQPIMYIHCGGTEGNPTMLGRYRFAGIGKTGDLA